MLARGRGGADGGERQGRRGMAKDGQGLSETTGNGEGRRGLPGTPGDGTSDVS